MNSPLPPKLHISYHPLVPQDYLNLRDSTLEELVVLAIGMRKGFDVYKEALTRLREIN